MQRLSARPHHVGSPYAKDNADWLLARFKEWGWDARIEQYDVGVREGIEDKCYAEAEKQAPRAAAAVDREAALITAAAQILEQGTR